MRWTWKLAAAGLCAVLAFDLVIGYGYYQDWRAVQRPGFTTRTYVDQSGVRRGYVMFVPQDLPEDERPPLLIFLNGAGQNGDNGVQHISNNFGQPIWEMQQRFPFVCLAPQCREGGNWSADSLDTLTALEILDQVIEEYRINPYRVYLTGVSAGGTGVWNIAAAYPERFAAVVPLCGASCGLPPEDAADAYAAANLPIWNFYNGGDKEGLVSFNRDMYRELIERGLSPVFVEYDMTGHNCWDWAYRCPAMYDWLLRQNRQSNARHTKFHLLPIDESLSGWQRDDGDRWSTEEGELHVGPSQDVQESGVLMHDSPFDDFELHFDYRSDDGHGFEVVLQSAARVKDQFRVVIVWPNDGSGGVIDSETGQWLSGTGSLAQQALLRGQWNDVRVRRRDDRLSVRVNGLTLIDTIDLGLDGPYRFGFGAASSNNDGRWRFLRVRSGQPNDLDTAELP